MSHGRICHVAFEMLPVASAERCGGSLITAASLEFALLEPEKTSSLHSVEKRCGNDGISPPNPPSPKPQHKTRDTENEAQNRVARFCGSIFLIP